MNKKINFKLFPWLLVLYEITIYLSMDAYVPALPKISQTFSVSSNLAQFTVVVWTLGALLVQLIFGPLSDRYGRRPVLLFGGVLYVFSTILCAISFNIHLLLMARFFQGMAMPSMYIAGYAAINELFDTEKAVHILATMNGVTILAPAFGPLLGGAFLLYASWHWIFVILAVCSAAVVSILFFKMPETAPIEIRQKKINILDILRHYGFVMKNFKFMSNALIAFLPIIGLISWMLAGPFIVIHVFHHSVLVFAVIQLFIFGSFILGTKIVKRIANQDLFQILVNTGLTLALLGAISATVVGHYFSEHLLAMVVSMMVLTLGVGFSIPILSRLTLDASDAPMGVKVTVFSVVRNLSGFLGAICVAIFYGGTFVSVAVIILSFVIFSVLLRIFQ